ncbi:NAD(P)-binding domain-containing protein [Pelagibacteraceae bacterium]|nr:NAD(P)-binding domain-containing protein [Pelagibacteraceae bacterium]
MKNILLIGCGHMGGSLMSGWSNSKNYTINVIDKKKYAILKNRNRNKKIKFFKSINEINDQNNFDFIIFATRPLELPNVFKELKNINFNKKTIAISVIAGKKTEIFKNNLLNINKIVRVMPNMPALIGEGVHCIYTNKSINKKEIKEIDKLFSLSGKTLFFKNETLIDKATAVSGSGPGFIFQLIDIMEKSAINLGFSKKTAEILISETFRGSINLLNSNNISAEKMVKTVATIGGTTEAGIKIMKINKVDNIFNQVFKAAYTRAKQQGDGK